ncbi:MAG: glycine cleavage system protein GcvH [Planctomycetota bacterium]
MADAEIPDDLLYTEEHEWIRAEGGAATVGITDYAQGALGDVTFVELPEVGAELSEGEEFAVVESLKAASDVYAPASGTVTAINNLLEEEPNKVNEDPYGDGWLCKLEDVPAAELDELLSPEQYRDLLESEDA